MVTENIMPRDWVRTAQGWQLWGHFCRGGGGANSELLEGLQALLAKASKSAAPPVPPKGKGKKAAGDGTSSSSPISASTASKGKGQGNQIMSDSDLLRPTCCLGGCRQGCTEGLE